MDKSKKLSLILQSFEAGGVLGAIVVDYRANKDNKHNVRYRLTYKGDRQYINAGYAYTLNDWERINSKLVKDSTLKSEKDAIIKKFEEIKKNITEIETDGKPFSFELLNRRIGRGDKNNLFLAFEEKINRLMKEGRVGTALTYTNTVGSLWMFHNDYKGKEPFSRLYTSGEWLRKPYSAPTFDNITVDFINSYKAWLKIPYKTYSGKKTKVRSDATIGIYLRSLRAILNENDVPASKYPFGKNKVEIPAAESRKVALNKDVISHIVAHPLTGNDAMYRDIWVFSYLCNGANLKDVLRFRKKNVANGFIYYKRAKTERYKNPPEIKVKIHPEMRRIIDEWGNSDNDNESFLFPILQPGLTSFLEQKIRKDYTKRINNCIKKVCKELQVDANITLIAARHSWAVNTERSGVRLSLTQRGLGHKNPNTTRHYLGSFDDEELIKLSENLL